MWVICPYGTGYPPYSWRCTYPTALSPPVCQLPPPLTRPLPAATVGVGGLPPCVVLGGQPTRPEPAPWKLSPSSAQAGLEARVWPLGHKVAWRRWQGAPPDLQTQDTAGGAGGWPGPQEDEYLTVGRGSCNLGPDTDGRAEFFPSGFFDGEKKKIQALEICQPHSLHTVLGQSPKA